MSSQKKAVRGAKQPRVKQRVTREQWLAEGLKLLAEGGVDRIKIDVLARRLGVAKTGFYWHFKDRQSLLDSILEFWEHEFTQVISDNVEFVSLPPRERLMRISEAVYQYDLTQYDRAISGWAQFDEKAASVLQRVYQTRIDFVGAAFRELGFRGDELLVRTRLYVASASNERQMFHTSETPVERRRRKLRIALLVQPLVDRPA